RASQPVSSRRGCQSFSAVAPGRAKVKLRRLVAPRWRAESAPSLPVKFQTIGSMAADRPEAGSISAPDRDPDRHEDEKQQRGPGDEPRAALHVDRSAVILRARDARLY